MGWNDETIEIVTESDVMDKIEKMNYELKNCVQGAYTNCFSNEQLADYIQRCADELSNLADMVRDTRD